ncbi:hypothetical protein DOY81_014896 [Sarcophaga bullata]|nr:hypothetical protein DOY81_014896 [Sarcophaga bullata]
MLSIYIKKEKSKLLDNVTKNFGFAMGIEFRENSIIIGPKCQAEVKKNMVFNVNIGISNLSNPDASEKEAKTYALFIGDTVLVGDQSPASIMTPSKKKIKILVFSSKTTAKKKMVMKKKKLKKTRVLKFG